MIRIIYTPHRVEFLPLFSQQLKRFRVLVLEEPETIELRKLLSGEISAEEYAKWVDTGFPVYTTYLAKFLIDISNKIKILAVEPYLQVIEGIHLAVEEGRYDEYVKDELVQKVLRVERKATAKLLEYQEAFMTKDFERVVNSVIEFARADAERFVLRDRLRAKKIAEIESRDFAVEAGQIHFLLELELRELREVESVNLVEIASKIEGLKYIKNPGNELTEIYIKEFAGLSKEDADEELLAAQSLVYITLIRKDEMLPNKKKFPHLIDEIKCAKMARSLSYNQCKKFVENVWFKN